MLGGIVGCPGQPRPRKNDPGCSEEEFVPGKPTSVVARSTGGTIVVRAIEEAAGIGCADIVNGALSVVDEGRIEWLIARLDAGTCSPLAVGVSGEPEAVVPEPVRSRAISEPHQAFLLRHLFGKCTRSWRSRSAIHRFDGKGHEATVGLTGDAAGKYSIAGPLVRIDAVVGHV